MFTYIVIPMAGKGTRLSSLGLPKYATCPDGESSILELSIASFLPAPADTKWIFIATSRDNNAVNVESLIKPKLVAGSYDILTLPNSTSSQIETVLQAQHLVPPRSPMIVHNCDTYWRPERSAQMFNWCYDAWIGVFRSQSRLYSYVEIDSNGRITGVEERPETLSGFAATGTYGFRRSELFFELTQGLEASSSTGLEPHISEICHQLALDGTQIRPIMAREAWPLGTVEEQARFRAFKQR